MTSHTQRIYMSSKENYNDIARDPITGKYIGSKNGEITIISRKDENWENTKISLLKNKQQNEAAIFEGINTKPISKYQLGFIKGENYKLSPCGTQAVTTKANVKILTNIVLTKNKGLTWIVKSHQLSRAYTYGVTFTNEEESEDKSINISLNGPFGIKFAFDSDTGKIEIFYGNESNEIDVFFNSKFKEARFFITAPGTFSEFTLTPDVSGCDLDDISTEVKQSAVKEEVRALIFDIQENAKEALKKLGDEEGVDISKANADWTCILGKFNIEKMTEYSQENVDQFKILSIDNALKLVNGKAVTENEVLKKFLDEVKGELKVDDKELTEASIAFERISEVIETEESKAGIYYNKEFFDKSDSSFNIEYLSQGDQLLIQGEKSLKLLKRINGNFSPDEFLTEGNIPESVEDNITIKLNRNDVLLLTQTINWPDLIKILAGTESREHILGLFNYLESAIRNGKGVQEFAITGKIETLFIGFRILARFIISQFTGEEFSGNASATLLQAFTHVKQETELEEESSEINDAFGNLFNAKITQEGKAVLEIDEKDFKLTQNDDKQEKSNNELSYFNFEKISRLIFRIDEEIISKSPGLTLNESLDAYRGFTAFGRLVSFIQNKPSTRNMIQMVEAGLICIDPECSKYRSFFEPEKVLSGFEDQKFNNLNFYQILNNNNISLSNINIPLSVTLNSTPSLNFEEKIISVTQSNSSTIAVLFDNNKLSLYDTSLNLCLLGSSNIREQAKYGIRVGELLKDRTSFLSITDNVSDIVMKGLFNSDEEKEEVIEPEIVPDENKLNQLYMMGFPLELAKKALIETKNASVEAALDKITDLQEDFQNSNQPLNEAVSLLKPQWTCPFCTFINQTDQENPEPSCMICGNIAPTDAFYTKEEVRKMEEDKKRAIEAEAKKEEELRNKAKKEQEEDFVDKSPEEIKLGNIEALKLTQFNSNFLDRNIIVAAFNHDSSSALRFRRYGYEENYIKNLIKLGKYGKHFFTYLGNDNLESVLIEQGLTQSMKNEDDLIKIDNLIPTLQNNDKVLVARYEHDIRIENEKIVGLNVISSETQGDFDKILIRVVTLDKNDGFYYNSIYEISSKCFCYDTSSFEVKPIGDRVKIDIGPESAPIFVENSGYFVSGGKIYQFVENKLEIVQEITDDGFDTDIKHVKVTGDSFFVLRENGQIQEIEKIDTKRTQEIIETNENQTQDDSTAIGLKDINKYFQSKKFLKISVDHDSNLESTLEGNGNSSEQFGYKAKALVYSESSKLTIKPAESSSNGLLQVNFKFDKKNTSEEEKTKSEEKTEKSSENKSMIKLAGSTEEEKYIPVRVYEKTMVDNNNASNFGPALFNRKQYYIERIIDPTETRIVVLENIHEQMMRITDLILELTGISNQIFTDLLVFTTNHVGAVSIEENEHRKSKKSYNEFLTKKNKNLDRWLESEPVAHACGTYINKVTLNHIREAKYLVLVFYAGDSSITSLTNQIKFIGLQGSVVETDEVKCRDIQVANNGNQNSETGAVFSVSAGGKKIVDNVKVMVSDESNNEYVMISKNEVEFFENLGEIEIEFSSGEKHRIHQIEVQLIERSNSISHELKEIFSSEEKLLDLLKNFVKDLTNNETNSTTRIEIIETLVNIIENQEGEILRGISKFLNKEELIENVILKTTDLNLIRALELLFGKLIQSSEFVGDFTQEMAKILQKIEDMDSNPKSISNFLKLVKYCANTDKSEPLVKIMGDIIVKSSRSLQDLDSKKSKTLVALGIKNDPYDPYKIMMAKEDQKGGNSSSKKEVSLLTKNLEKIEYFACGTRNKNKFEFILDLKNATKVERVLIFLKDFLNPGYKFNLIIQVSSLTAGTWKEKLLTRKSYDESTVNYLKSSMRDKSIKFLNSEFLDSVGIEFNELTATHLKFLITIECPFNNVGFIIKKQKILPVVLGKRINEKLRDAFFPEYFVANVSKEFNIQGEVFDKIPLKIKFESEKEDKKDKKKKSKKSIDSNIPLLTTMLEKYESVEDSTEQAEHAANIKEISKAVWTELIEEESPNLVRGNQSVTFWKTIIKDIGQIVGEGKLKVTLENSEVNSFYSNILLQSSQNELYNIVYGLVQNVFSTCDDKKDLKSRLFSLIKHLCNKENAALVFDSKRITEFVKLLSNVEILKIETLINYVIKKLCKHYEEDPMKYIVQFNFILQILPKFIKFNNKMKVEDPSTITTLIQIILWLLEQENMNIRDKKILLRKCFRFTTQLLKRNNELIETYKFEKIHLEMLLIRTLKLNCFENMTEIIEFFNVSNKKESVIENQKVILDVFCQTLKQFFSYLKGNSEESEKISLLIQNTNLDSDSTIKFLTFLSKFTHSIATKVNDNSPKNEKEKEKYNIRKPMQNMTPEEVQQHRSLSLSSQVHESAEDEIIPGNLILDILQMIEDQYAENPLSCNFFMVISKFIFTKSVSKGTLLKLMQLLVNLKKDRLAMIIGDIQTIALNHYKTLKDEKEDKFSFKRFGSMMLEVLITIINEQENGVDSFNYEFHNFITTWFEITILGDQKMIPKIQFTKIESQLTSSSIKSLFSLVCRELMRSGNFGSKEGFNSLEKKHIYNLHWIDLALSILTKATVSDSQDTLLVASLSSIKEKEIKDLEEAFKFLFEWTILNSCPVIGQESPAQIMLRRINKNVDLIYELAGKNTSTSKIMVKMFVELVAKLDDFMIGKIKNNQIGFIGANYLENLFTTLGNIVEKSVVDDHMANYFTNECKGVEFILDRITSNKSSGKGEEEIKENNDEGVLSKFGMEVPKDSDTSDMDVLFTLDDSKKKKTGQSLVPRKNPTSFDVEFATNLKVVELSNHNVHATKDWQRFKRGSNRNIWFKVLKNDIYKEVGLTFELTKKIDLNCFKVGFLTQWQDYTDKVVAEPSYVHLQYKSGNSWKYLCELTRMIDNGYGTSAVAIYHKNFLRVEGDNSIDCINSICYPKNIKQFKLVIGRPEVSFIENYSSLRSRTFTNITLAISFVSILGADSTCYSITQIDKEIRESSLLEIFRNLYSKNFSSMDKLAHSESFISKVKPVFDRIVNNYVKYFTPALINFSKNNVEFGNWILNKLLKITYDAPYAKLVGEIVLSNPKVYKRRLSILLNFIFKELELAIGKKSNAPNLFNFIGVFSACIFKAPEGHEKENETEGVTSINQEKIDQLLTGIKAFPYSQQMKKFIATLLRIPQEILKIDFENPMVFFINQLIDKVVNQHSLQFLDILSVLGLSSEANSKIILESKVWDTIKTDLRSEKESNIQNTMKFIYNFINNDEFLLKIIEEEVDIGLFNYIKKKIKSKSGSFKQGSKTEILIRLAVKILNYIVVNSEDRSKKFAEKLLEECNKVKDYKENFQTFLNMAFLPLIDSVKTMKVTFKSPNKKLNKAVEEISSNEESLPEKKFDSSLILPEHKTLMESNLPNLLEPSMVEKFKKGRWEKSLSTPSDNYDFTEDFNNNVLGKGPFMILLDGESMGNKMVLGIFCGKGLEKPKSGKIPASMTVPNCRNHFLFLYECSNQKTTCHYNSSSNDEVFLRYSSSGDKGIMIMDTNAEKVYISATAGPGTHIDLYPMKCLTTDPNPNYEFPYDFQIKNGIEIWTLDTNFTEKDKKQAMNDFQIDTIVEDNELINLEYSYFNENMVYNLPSNLKIRNFKKAIFEDDDKDEEIKLKVAQEGLEYGIEDTVETIFEKFREKGVKNGILEIEYPDSLELKDTTFKALSEFYSPEMNLLKEFNKLKGFDFILEQCGKIIDSDWTGKSYFTEWKNVISDIKYYTKIKNFTSNFIVREDSIETLMIIFTKDKNRTEKWWTQKAENMFVNIYTAVSNIFEFDHTAELRENLIEDGIITKLLKKLQFISKETTRKFIEDFKEDEPKTPVKPKEEMGEDEGTGKKKLEKRKGVGYGPGNSNKSTWTTKDYIELKNKKNIKIMTLLKIIKNLLASEQWIPHEKLLRIFCESCVLSLIENSLRCSSLLEMAKEKELYEHYLDLIDEMSKLEVLIGTLMPLDKNYQPKQIESVHSLLTKRAEGAKLFIKIGASSGEMEGEGEEAENNRKAFELSKKMISIFERVDEIIMNSEAYKQMLKDEAMHYKDLPMREAYKLLLKDQRFGYVDMKVNGGYKHHWKSQFQGKSAPQASKMIRLAQEIADLSTSLPVDSTNAMFVRADEERLDVMTAIIFGAEGTPYAHGAFLYDMYCVENYPQSSPKVNLETTGNQDVRFNPNLYANGKVCLSLLGTWRGSASENWDPKLSNLNQILMSIQSVVMSEEVYFNEPGYQHEAGTEIGEAKNEAYCNIVRLCNMKHAMVGQINNPPKGYEDVIRTHFYLKKDLILKDIKKWRKISENNDAVYKGLVMDHNYKYCERFNKEAKKYFEEFDEQVSLLTKALDSLEAPPIDSLLENKLSKKTKKKERKENIDITKDVIDFSNIDMTYDEDITAKLKEISIDDAGVKDRWSRYIGVMGMEAVRKQAAACVMISGLDALGVEIAKNVILSGVKRLTLHDHVESSWTDLNGQFFISEEDVKAKKNRAEACKNKIQQLNYYVRVDTRQTDKSLPTDIEKAKELYSDYNLVILIGKTHEEISTASKVCETEKKKLIVADCKGVFSRIFCDYGKGFMVFDKNGEEVQEILIENIEVVDNEKAKVTLMKGVKSPYEDGNTIILDRIEGMEFKKEEPEEKKEGEEEKKEGEEEKKEETEEKKEGEEEKKEETEEKKEGEEKVNKNVLSPNGNYYKVKTIRFDSFYLMGDFTKCSPYIRGGIAKLIKVPKKIDFKPYHEVYDTNEPGFEMNLLMHDFMKLGHPQITHIAFNAYNEFLSTKKSSPKAYSLADAKEFYSIAEKLAKSEKFKEMVDLEDEDSLKKFKNLIFKFALSGNGTFAPQCAYIGGIVAQEVIKAITGKFMPINQLMYADSIEVLDETAFPENIEELDEKAYNEIASKAGVVAKENRYDGLRLVIGEAMLDKIKHSSLFMIGSGAIGCELLKNYAMIGFGTGKGKEVEQTTEDGKVEKVAIPPGRITLTDPDVIEVSNLNRQFLFREKHLRKPKSLTAAAAAQVMNPDLKGNMFARLDKVWPGTAHIYTDDFFEKLSIVTNALDNIQARRYIDMRCVAARTPLLESGTLGPKGHVQVVVPFKTESYGSMDDPEEEFEIPHCTLKMFPEETLHCVEWARDLFGKYFTQEPKALKKCLEILESGETISVDEIKALKDAVNLGKEQPHEFDDCVEFARLKFQEFFHNDIKQLLFVYPLDHQDKDGNPFWKLPKRPPHHLDYSAEDELHKKFIIAFACLRANIFGIELPEEIREADIQTQIATVASKIKIEPFVPSEEKAKEIAEENEAEENKDEDKEEKEEEEETNEDESYESLLAELKKIAKNLKSEHLKPEEFEKDNDTNFHIDSIYSMANLRANNYTLDPMDWMTVKIKAGRIIPALATTTASIAGLQTLELVKVLKGIKLEDIKNAFLNLAVPYLTQSEPAPVPKVKIREDYEVSIWDRWEFKDCKEKTLKDIFDGIIENYKMYPKDVIQGAKPIYMKAMGGDDVLKKKLVDLFDVQEGDHEDLTITCGLTDETKEIVPGAPGVRLFF